MKQHFSIELHAFVPLLSGKIPCSYYCSINHILNRWRQNHICKTNLVKASINKIQIHGLVSMIGEQLDKVQ